MGAMRITDVTPDWIAKQRDALGLKDVDIHNRIGMHQAAFSKAMNGKRRFQPAELQAIFDYLTSPEAAARAPLVAEARSLAPLLRPNDLEWITSTMRRLAAQGDASGGRPPEGPEGSSD